MYNILKNEINNIQTFIIYRKKTHIIHTNQSKYRHLLNSVY